MPSSQKFLLNFIKMPHTNWHPQSTTLYKLELSRDSNKECDIFPSTAYFFNLISPCTSRQHLNQCQQTQIWTIAIKRKDYLRKQFTGEVIPRFEMLLKSIEKQKWWADGSIGGLVPREGTLLGPGAGPWDWGGWRGIALGFLGDASAWRKKRWDKIQPCSNFPVFSWHLK